MIKMLLVSFITYIVTSDLNSLLSNVTMTAAVPQKQYENVDPSAYNLRLDLSRISGTGDQEIRLTSTNSSTYGRVVSTSPASITVHVEEYVVARVVQQVQEDLQLVKAAVGDYEECVLHAVTGPRRSNRPKRPCLMPLNMLANFLPFCFSPSRMPLK